jgi:hypothetical protein
MCKDFLHGSDFNQHQNIHTGKRSYECKECGKASSWDSELNQHQKMHTGISPYECGECGKVFLWVLQLILHQGMHIDEEPYVNSVCNPLPGADSLYDIGKFILMKLFSYRSYLRAENSQL